MTMVKKQRSESVSTSLQTASAARLVLNMVSDPPVVTIAMVNEVWDSHLCPALGTILEGDYEGLTGRRELLYRQVERLVKLDFGKNLIDRIETEMNRFCSSLFGRSSLTSSSIVEAFEKFNQGLKLISRIFNALDRDLMYKSSRCSSVSIRSITWLGYSVWRNHLEVDRTTQVVEDTLNLITSYRTKMQNIDQIQKNINMLIKIEIFASSFENKFLSSTRDYYCEVSEQDRSLSDYVSFVHSAIEFERQFVDSINIPSNTWKQVDNDILRSELILNRLPKHIQPGLLGLVQQVDVKTVRSLFNLCLLMPEKFIVESVLKFSFQEAVNSVCSASCGSIDSIIKVRQDMQKILVESFDSRPSFLGAYKDAMESVLNSETSSGVPSMLASWIDDQLFTVIDKEEESGMSDVVDWMPDMIGVFKLLISKDIFEVHYRSFLAKRLLYISSNYTVLGQLINQETAIVNLLKQECGAGYTNKLETMIRDVAVSEEMEAEKNEKLDLKVSVITAGVWPLTPWADRTNLAPLLEESEIGFMKSFIAKNAKKSLKFVHSMTSAVVRYKRREFVCSAAQALILNLLNDTDTIDKQMVMDETKIPESEVSKALSVLEESGLLTDKNGLFSVNQSHKLPSGRIALNKYQFRRGIGEAAISEEDRMQTESSVMEDRQHQLDAAIVRIMKSLRKASQSTVYTEALSATKFAFSKQEINKRITSLVDREFLERDPGEDGEIRYLA
jgi:cullin-4